MLWSLVLVAHHMRGGFIISLSPLPLITQSNLLKYVYWQQEMGESDLTPIYTKMA